MHLIPIDRSLDQCSIKWINLLLYVRYLELDVITSVPNQLFLLLAVS